MDLINELCELLREAGAKPFWNTHYMSPEQRARAFRMRAWARLHGRRLAIRHFDPSA